MGLSGIHIPSTTYFKLCHAMLHKFSQKQWDVESPWHLEKSAKIGSPVVQLRILLAQSEAH